MFLCGKMSWEDRKRDTVLPPTSVFSMSLPTPIQCLLWSGWTRVSGGTPALNKAIMGGRWRLRGHVRGLNGVQLLENLRATKRESTGGIPVRHTTVEAGISTTSHLESHA